MSNRPALGFGLIHGGFHAGWCWDEVRKRLDWPSVAVDLPGRTGSAQALSAITYEDWVSSATADIAALQVDRLVLVAHSLGGITLPVVAERLASRVRHAVFIAAVMPPEGKAFVDLDHPLEEGEGIWPRPPRDALAYSLCSDMPPGSIDALLPKLAAAEPLGPLRQPISRRTMPRIPTTFVRATGDVTGCLAELDAPGSPLEREFPQARVVRIDAGHNLIITAAARVAALLDDIARDLARPS